MERVRSSINLSASTIENFDEMISRIFPCSQVTPLEFTDFRPPVSLLLGFKVILSHIFVQVSVLVHLQR